MIARHGSRRSKAHRVTGQKSRMESDCEDGISGDEGEGYRDESEPELEAGCIGVKDPREQKRDKSLVRQRLRLLVFVVFFVILGALLPFLAMAYLDAAAIFLASDGATGNQDEVGAVHKRTGAVAGKGNLSLGVSGASLAQSLGARSQRPWGQTSIPTKAALRALIKAGNVTSDPGWLDEELDAKWLVFATGEGSCLDVCNVGGKEWMCDAAWFVHLNHCPVLHAAFPGASGCLETMYGRDLPALSRGIGALPGGRVMVNADMRPVPEADTTVNIMHKYQSTCDALSDHSERVCPCRKRHVLEEETDLHQRVAKVVVRQLRGLELSLVSKGSKDKASQSMHGAINEFWATHKPMDLVDDIKGRRVTFVEAARGSNCFDKCQEVGLACQRHWFDVLNNCEALQASFPKHEQCSELFYGRDLPAFRPEDATVLVNKEPKTYAASCGGRHSKTMRLCGCGVAKGGPTSARTFHTVYNVEASKYFEWQVRYMHLWFRQAGMQGAITRLLSADAADHLVREGIPTHVSAPYRSPLANDVYKPYNKPWSVTRWLAEVKPSEDNIIIVDPDCMFVKRMELVVEEGSPIAQQAFYSFDFSKDDVPMQVARRYCKGCKFLDPIAVPIIIHRRDIEKIAPRWLDKTLEIRKDRDNWLPEWSNTSASPVGLAWTAEMFGYVFAASELGIRHEIWDLQNVPPVHKELFTSIIHYHVQVPLPAPVMGRHAWFKHDENAGYEIPWPLPPGTDEVTALTLSKLHEAYQTLGRSNFTWHTQTRYESETRRRHRRHLRHVRHLAAVTHSALETPAQVGWDRESAGEGRRDVEGGAGRDMAPAHTAGVGVKSHVRESTP